VGFLEHRNLPNSAGILGLHGTSMLYKSCITLLQGLILYIISVLPSFNAERSLLLHILLQNDHN